MIRVQKFKFGNRFESFETKNIKVVTKALKDYRFCSDNLYIHTKFVGEYAKVDVLDVNGKHVKTI
jgi:hypothetical protein